MLPRSLQVASVLPYGSRVREISSADIETSARHSTSANAGTRQSQRLSGKLPRWSVAMPKNTSTPSAMTEPKKSGESVGPVPRKSARQSRHATPVSIAIATSDRLNLRTALAS